MAEAIRLVSDGALDGDGGDGPTRLPHNIEAEAALLGALLLDNRVA